MNSFIGVIGSKASVSQDLIERMPQEAFGSCYIELFAGGAAVFFAKNPARINVLNDADPDLALVHDAIQRDVEAVQRLLAALCPQQASTAEDDATWGGHGSESHGTRARGARGADADKC
ncbi:MAG: DNA adenine methylase [Planctomycetes bacterium]|nr:DNA adenine methylase [Planctomycetota bacterium]